MPPKKKNVPPSKLRQSLQADEMAAFHWPSDIPKPHDPLANYNDHQRNEYRALDAVYPGDVQIIKGRKSAWQVSYLKAPSRSILTTEGLRQPSVLMPH